MGLAGKIACPGALMVKHINPSQFPEIHRVNSHNYRNSHRRQPRANPLNQSLNCPNKTAA